MRNAIINRNTGETQIRIGLELDGKGTADLCGGTGIGFFDHMLNAFARHGLFDLDVEAKGDLVEAAAQMSRLLDVAYQPEVICLAYWKLSQIAWNSGDVLLADACMRMCLRYSSGGMFEPMASFATMLSDSAGSVLSNAAPELVEGVLHMRNVPVAPTDEVVAALEECTRAAVDAEVFPAARDLARALGKLTADDVIWGIARSIEHEPDR